jgi:8-oxo-dGTP pyrophosphatase MutT (NUDIX family)
MEISKQYIDKLAWIYVKDRKILSTRSKNKDTYYIPGGKRERDETDEQALIREIKEELSVDIVRESIKPFGVFEAQAHGKPEGTIVRMTCCTADFTGELKPNSEIDEMVWLSHEGREMSSPVDKLILDDLKEKNLID